MSDQRLKAIFAINPDWASMIVAFVDDQPEFKPYLYLASLTDRGVSPCLQHALKGKFLGNLIFNGANRGWKGSHCYVDH